MCHDCAATASVGVFVSPSEHTACSPLPNLFTQVWRVVKRVCVCVCVFITTERICRRSQALILREGCKRLSKLASVATADYCGPDTQGEGGWR